MNTCILPRCTKKGLLTVLNVARCFKAFFFSFYWCKFVAKCWSPLTHVNKFTSNGWKGRSCIFFFLPLQRSYFYVIFTHFIVHGYTIQQALSILIIHVILFTHCFTFSGTLLLWPFNVVTVNAPSITCKSITDVIYQEFIYCVLSQPHLRLNKC